MLLLIINDLSIGGYGAQAAQTGVWTFDDPLRTNGALGYQPRASPRRGRRPGSCAPSRQPLWAWNSPIPLARRAVCAWQ
ncbi:MAG TPA: hypothetical protein VNH84_22520, partial [Candidatus Saccharimonadales bacterium]|nr:hypothetical protein [Candidatus Saccharimonadales bacterium]